MSLQFSSSKKKSCALLIEVPERAIEPRLPREMSHKSYSYVRTRSVTNYDCLPSNLDDFICPTSPLLITPSGSSSRFIPAVLEQFSQFNRSIERITRIDHFQTQICCCWIIQNRMLANAHEEWIVCVKVKSLIFESAICNSGCHLADWRKTLLMSALQYWGRVLFPSSKV